MAERSRFSPPNTVVTVASLGDEKRKRKAKSDSRCCGRNRACGHGFRAFLRRRWLRSDDPGVCRHGGLVAAGSRCSIRYRIRLVEHRPTCGRCSRTLCGVRRLDLDLGALGGGRRARVRAVQPGRALRRRIRDRHRARAAVPARVLIGGVAVALVGVARRRARQPLLPEHLRRRPGRGDPEPAQQRPAQLPARLLERAGDRGRARLSAAALAHELAEVADREHPRGACPCRFSPRSCTSPRRAAPSWRRGSPW